MNTTEIQNFAKLQDTFRRNLVADLRRLLLLTGNISQHDQKPADFFSFYVCDWLGIYEIQSNGTNGSDRDIIRLIEESKICLDDAIVLWHDLKSIAKEPEAQDQESKTHIPQPPMVYLIFGEQVSELILNEGFDELVEAIENDSLEYATYAYQKGDDVGDLLYNITQWDEYAFITADEYEKLQNL